MFALSVDFENPPIKKEKKTTESSQLEVKMNSFEVNVHEYMHAEGSSMRILNMNINNNNISSIIIIISIHIDLVICILLFDIIVSSSSGNLPSADVTEALV